MRYGAIVDGKRGAYGVVVPDLPGCTAMGTTIDEAIDAAAAAARAWAAVIEADGGTIPKPRPLEALRRDPQVAAELAQDGTLAMVSVILDSSRSVKANLSFDAALLKAIDDAAERKKLTRSAFVASAAREKIAAEGG
jgi:predicted RNase H-like HicB family nuclease